MDKNKIIVKTKNFFNWILQECKDKTTIILFIFFLIIMTTPAWLGFLLYFIFGWKSSLAIASAYVLFWAGPFTPFFPICIAITLSMKKIIEKLKDKNKK